MSGERICAQSLLEQLRGEVRETLSGFEQIGDEELYDCIDQAIVGQAGRQYLPLVQRIELKNRLFDSFRRLGILQELVDDETVTEIMVNGPDQIFIERNGCLEETKYHFSSNEKLDDVIQRIASANNKMANTSHPIVDTRLADGSRVNMVLAPIAVDHSVLSIRKFPKEQITMEKLIAWQALSQ